MVYTLRFYLLKCSLFHNSNLFGSCIINILYTVCAKIKKKNNSGTKRLKVKENSRAKAPQILPLPMFLKSLDTRIGPQYQEQLLNYRRRRLVIPSFRRHVLR